MSSKVLGEEMRDEMFGILTAISIVCKRLAVRLADLDEEENSKISNVNIKNKL